MIFENISHITRKDQFIELVSIYIRLVEVFSERNCYELPCNIPISVEIIRELKDMGIINADDDIVILKKTIGDALFHRLIDAVGFYLTNENTIGHLLDKLSNRKRRSLQQKEKMSNKPTLVDFFAGAGGLSLGFIQAGFRVVFANDVEDVCIETYKYNHPELPSNKLMDADIRSLISSLDKYIDEQVDIVVGGPPCQGFSSANQQRIIDDPRNELYKYFVAAIREILPKFVVMENVHGMLSVANQVVEDYQSIKEKRNGVQYTYLVAYRLLNSVDFSVAQSRERLIYIAIRNDVADELNITPWKLFENIEESCKANPHYVLQDALEYIKPLEAPRIKNQNEVDTDSTGKKIDVNKYQGDDNAYLKVINEGRKIPYVYNHKARYLNDTNYDIYRLLNQGEDASNEKISDIMPYKHRLHCFKDKYYKLIADRPSRTITAHLKMDCHSHIHPFQVRAITPREAARCQSFPDDYMFLGAYLKTYMQIGNAVPCKMAYGIAKEIIKYIK